MRGKIDYNSDKLLTNTEAGLYNPHKQFGADVGHMTIGQKSVDRSDTYIPGPGTYEIDKADKITKQSSLAQTMGGKLNYNSAKLLTSAEAGMYNPHKEFGVNVRKMTIG